MGSQAALRPSLLQQRTLGHWVRHARAPGRTLRPRPAQSKVVRALISRAMGQGKASHSEAAVIIPLNYAQLLGLRGKEMYVDPQVSAAYEELLSSPLEEGYSNVAKLGKEKLLFAAREGLRGVRGRVSLIPQEISIEPVLLAGAMALLEQVGEYSLVLQLSEQAQTLGAAALRSSSKDTLRDFERDVVLATALAHCGLAREAFDAGQVGPGCARMEEALRLLNSGGAPTMPLASRGPPLAPGLQQEISDALVELRAESLLGYLQATPDSDEAVANRKQALESLKSMVQGRSPGGAAAGQRAGGARRPEGGEYLQRALPSLTSWEIVELLDWGRVAANKTAFGWYYPGLLESAAVAHIVAGFAQRRPALIETAMKLLRAVRMEADVAVELAVCEVLLGSPDLALTMLREDERIGVALSGKALGAFGAGSADFPSRDGVMEFIRQRSPEGEADLLPGLCLFVEKWLQRFAFPRLRDTAQLPPQPSLVAYFQDPHVEAFLSRRESDSSALSPLASLLDMAAKGTSTAAAAMVGLLSMPVRGLHHLRLMGVLQLRWVAAAVLLAGAALGLGRALQGRNLRDLASSSGPVIAEAVETVQHRVQQAQQQREAAVRQQETAAVQKKAAAKESAAREAATKEAAAKEAAAQEAAQQRSQQQTQQQQTQRATLLKVDAERVVKQWLRAKADAMGPRHNLQRLPDVLAEPMLSQVTAEVREAQSAGWFWTIRPLNVKVDSINVNNLRRDGSGFAVVVATVDESADLWATNGKKGDSYKTTYKVEYTLEQAEGAWKISSALVLGK